MTTIKSFSDLKQSKKLAEILPFESADIFYDGYKDELNGEQTYTYYMEFVSDWKSAYPDKPLFEKDNDKCIPAWSLAALIDVLPEINGTPLKIEKVKAEDGYDGYYYPIEYDGIVLIPYSKNPVDACYEMIEHLHKLKLL